MSLEEAGNCFTGVMGTRTVRKRVGAGRSCAQERPAALDRALAAVELGSAAGAAAHQC